MKFIAEVKRMGRTLVVETPYGVNVEDGKYSIEITDYKKNRSLNQNALLWKIINAISKKENGSYAGAEDIYLNLLEMAGAKCEYLLVSNEAVEGLKSLYRDIRVVKEDKGKSIVKAYYGSSKMNTQEMSELIKVAEDYAIEVGLDISQFGDA